MNRMKAIIWLAALCAAGGAVAMTLDDITFLDDHAGEVGMTATVSGLGAGGGLVWWDATLDNDLLKIYGEPDQLNPGATTWSSAWNPYFRGTYNFDFKALALPPMGPHAVFTDNHDIGADREISGVLNAIRYLSAPDDWRDINPSKVKLHCIGYNTEDDVASIGCNLLNADYDPSHAGMNPDPEEIDIAMTDIAGHHPAGTPFRFEMQLHARPHSLMGMGELTFFVWSPDDPNDAAGPGALVVGVESCSPWRSDYAQPLESHVGFAPLYFDDEDAQELGGVLMCTTAHYMDVAPSMSEDDSDRIGLLVNGHPGNTNYLKAFLPDRILDEWGITRLDDVDAVRSQLGYFIDGIALDATVAAPIVTRVEAGSEDYHFSWSGDGETDAGYLVQFSFIFPEASQGARARARGVAAEIGPREAPPAPVGPIIKVNGETGNIMVEEQTPLNITVQLNPGAYAGIEVDWFVAACRYEWAGMPDTAPPEYFYLDDTGLWLQFDAGYLDSCGPVHMGPLFNLPPHTIMSTTLPLGVYQFWFVVDFPMNDRLDLIEGQYLMSTVILTVTN